MENAYVISVKKIKDYNGDPIKPEEQEFRYFQFDNYSGSRSTGYPCFGWACHAEHFKSVKDAVDCFNKHFNALTLTENPLNYDLSTLAVRKVVFKTKEKLQWGNNNNK